MLRLAAAIALCLVSWWSCAAEAHRHRKHAVSDGGAAPATAQTSTNDVVADVVVLDYGREVYRGPVDLGPTLRRIAAGEHFPHRDDGTVFQNRESLLPPKPSGHYHEYVHPTPNLRGPGPQRVILGADGEVFYTPDHYNTFRRLR